MERYSTHTETNDLATRSSTNIPRKGAFYSSHTQPKHRHTKHLFEQPKRVMRLLHTHDIFLRALACSTSLTNIAAVGSEAISQLFQLVCVNSCIQACQVVSIQAPQQDGCGAYSHNLSPCATRHEAPPHGLLLLCGSRSVLSMYQFLPLCMCLRAPVYVCMRLHVRRLMTQGLHHIQSRVRGASLEAARDIDTGLLVSK